MPRIFWLLLLTFTFQLTVFAQTRVTVADNSWLGPDGSAANGTIIIRPSNAFTSADGYGTAQNLPINVVVVNGHFSVSLIPNQGSSAGTCAPPVVCSFYRVTYSLSGLAWAANWTVSWWVPLTGPVTRLQVETAGGTTPSLLNAEPVNTVLAGPSTGSSASPAFRRLGLADLPPLGAEGDRLAYHSGADVAFPGNATAVPMLLESVRPWTLARSAVFWGNPTGVFDVSLPVSGLAPAPSDFSVAANLAFAACTSAHCVFDGSDFKGQTLSMSQTIVVPAGSELILPFGATINMASGTYFDVSHADGAHIHGVGGAGTTTQRRRIPPPTTRPFSARGLDLRLP